MGADHGHGSGHHHEPYVVPDYRIYKVSDAPQLVEIEKALAAKGLKDPWLRNEVWRYDVKEWGTVGSRAKLVFRGFGYGFVAFVATVIGTEAYKRMYPNENEHGHGNGNGHH